MKPKKSKALFWNIGAIFVIALAGSSGFAQNALSPSAQTLRAQIKVHCAGCHSGAGEGVPFTGDFLKTSDLLQSVNLKVPERSLIYQKVSRGEMPPDGGLARDDREAFQAALLSWLQAGAPSIDSKAKRKFIADLEVLKAVTNDAANDADPRDVRYISLVTLANQGMSEAEIDGIAKGVSKLVNSLSWKSKLTSPKAVAGSPLLLKIKLSDYSLTAALWDKLTAAYPYAQSVRFANEYKDLKSRTGAAIAIVRADWFLATASLPPHYYNLLQLPNTTRELEKFLGVDLADNIVKGNVLRAGFNNSGVSQHNRIIERSATQFGAYWSSYDFSTSSGRQSIFDFPLGPVKTESEKTFGFETFQHAGGEYIFNLRNGLQGYMLSDNTGKRIDAGPLNIVSDSLRPDRVVRAGASCFSCHAGGINRKDDQISAFVGFAKANTSDKDRYFKDRVQTLYGRLNEIDTAIDGDRKRHESALVALGVNTATDAAREPIAAMLRFYEQDVDLTRVASEFGLEVDDFLERLKVTQDRATNTVSRFLLHFLTLPGGRVSREYLQSNFDTIASLLLGGGGPVVVPTPPPIVDPFAGKPAEIKKACNTRRECVLRSGDEVHFRRPDNSEATVAYNLDAPFAYLDINESGQWVALTSRSLFAGNAPDPVSSTTTSTVPSVEFSDRHGCGRATPTPAPAPVTPERKMKGYSDEIKVGAARILENGRWVAVLANEVVTGYAGNSSSSIRTTTLRQPLVRVALDIEGTRTIKLTGKRADGTILEEKYATQF